MTSSDVIKDLYAGLPDKLRQELAVHEQAVTVPEGTALLQCGTYPQQLIILHSGSVETSVLVAGKPLSLGVAGAGRVFGLQSILAKTPTDTSVTCLEECQVILVPKKAFLDALRRNPQMYLAVAKLLSVDLQKAHGFLRRNGRRPGRRGTSIPRSRK
ncbi:MAG TPA: Crp/Fnr family transcriptional regulator [Candidatus Angelobacter sp.]